MFYMVKIEVDDEAQPAASGQDNVTAHRSALTEHLEPHGYKVCGISEHYPETSAE